MTPLMYAVKDSKTTFLERLIDLGSDVTARNSVSIQQIILYISATTRVMMYYYYMANIY